MRATDALMGMSYTGNQSDNLGLDLSIGGQDGANLALGLRLPNGSTAGEWINNTPYITQNVIPFLMDAPEAFKLFPNSEKLHRHLKELIEVRSTTISGILFNTTVERDEATFGRSGQVHAEVNKVAMARIEPVHEWREVQGLPIHQFWDFYIQYLLGDVNMGFPLVTRFSNYTSNEYTPDFKTFTVLYVIPDLAHKRAVKAVLQANMMPDNSGSLDFKRDLTAAGETITHSINFGGISQVTEEVRKLGTKMLQGLNTLDVNPDLVPAFQPEVSAEIANQADTGYNKISNPTP